jgi:hypothetical protein
MFNRRYCRIVRVGEVIPIVMKKIKANYERERLGEVESKISQEEVEPDF